MKPLTQIIIFILCCLGLPLLLHAGPTPPPRTIFEQFIRPDDQLVSLTITTDLRQLNKKKYAPEYQTAEITYADANGQPVLRKAEIKVRGNMRKRICNYPPLKLKFAKSDVRNEGLQPYRKLKLVVQCQNSAVCEQYIYKEYLAYKMYNQMTPFSFRVQLLKIKLVDSAGKKKDRELYGFIIEPEAELADRVGGEMVTLRPDLPKRIARESGYRLSLFQYMIGNTDWSLSHGHNMKFLRVPALQRPVPIPYDFDYAGLVDAHYAVPHESLPIKRVTERLYGGMMCPRNLAPSVLRDFLSMEAAFLGRCQDFPYLDEYTSTQMLRFLDGFFTEAKNEDQMVAVMGRP